jgi:hypothetical protein
MTSCVFNTKFLKNNNNKIFILNEYENYDLDILNNNYFIDINNIQKDDSFELLGNKVNYTIIDFSDDLIIKFNIDKKVDSIELQKIMHIIYFYLSSLKSLINIDDLYNNLKDSVINKYDKYYII